MSAEESRVKCTKRRARKICIGKLPGENSEDHIQQGIAVDAHPSHTFYSTSGNAERSVALLKEIVKDDLDIIECKVTDTNTNKAKSIAWQKIHNRFTQLNVRHRNLMELKQQWRCIKMEAKKSTSMNQAIQDPGGEPKPPSSNKDMPVVEIMEMIPLKFEVDENEFNTDCLQPITDTTPVYADCGRETIEEAEPCSSSQLNSCSEVQGTSLASEDPIEENIPPTDRKQKCSRRRQLFQEDECRISTQQVAEKKSEMLTQQEKEHLKRMANLEKEMDMKELEHEERMRNIREEMGMRRKEHEDRLRINQLKYEILYLKKKLLQGNCEK
ncbi:uncharacterized protein [Periplaneta americana]|uniref:uncharacterized protein isoform X2 n=1 Tax=Periplaneta americana TaxID=6978 RepID=UPI0037E82162